MEVLAGRMVLTPELMLMMVPLAMPAPIPLQAPVTTAT
jgi:hypothetical protein